MTTYFQQRNAKPETVLEMLRICADQLILAYDETLDRNLWLACEKTGEACEHLFTLVHSSQDNFITKH